ncbi:MAG TPA: FG-GAP repeat protein [Phycisphaerales bacterium]|nr:FG-GAP repeat protein [Phycisphaerales bacterium]
MKRHSLLTSWVAPLVAAAAAAQQYELAKLLPNDGEAGDIFGQAVAIHGDIVVIGAPGDDDNGSNAGAAYTFDVSDPENPTQIVKLLPTDAVPEDSFGEQVAISGRIVLVAANGLRDGFDFYGSAYLFDAVTGEQFAKLESADGQFRDLFGAGIAIAGARALVGVPGEDGPGEFSGAVHVFDITDPRRPALLGKLRADDAGESDGFGSAVASSDGIALIGAPLDDDGSMLNAGSAYLFDLSTGVQLSKITPSDPRQWGSFGNEVAISGARAVITSEMHAEESVYLFDVSDPARPVQMVKLLPRDGPFENFGISVGALGGIVGIGANEHTYGVQRRGAVHLVDAATGEQTAKLLASDAGDADFLGNSIGLAGTLLIAGARADDDNGDQAGAAYLFTLAPCRADLTGDGEADSVDFLVYLVLWGEADARAEWNGDDRIDTRDFLAFLHDWTMGC